MSARERFYLEPLSRYRPVSIFTNSFCAHKLLIVRPTRSSMGSSNSLLTNTSLSHWLIWALLATPVSVRIRNSTIVVARNNAGISVIPRTESFARGKSKFSTTAAVLSSDAPRALGGMIPKLVACRTIAGILVSSNAEAVQVRHSPYGSCGVMVQHLVH